MKPILAFIAVAGVLITGCVTSKVAPKDVERFRTIKTVELVFEGWSDRQVSGENGYVVAQKSPMGWGHTFDAQRNDIEPFAQQFLKDLGFEVVAPRVKADAKVWITYGTTEYSNLRAGIAQPSSFGKTPVYLNDVAPYAARSWCFLQVSSPKMNIIRRSFRIDGTSVDDAVRKMNFHKGMTELFTELCGSERVNQSLQKSTLH